MNRCFYFLFFLFHCWNTSNAVIPHELVIDEDLVNLKEVAYTLEDSTDSLGIDDVIFKKWIKTDGISSFGINWHVRWFSYNFNNTSNQDIKKVLFIPYDHIYEVDVWQATESKLPVKLYSTGVMRDISQKPVSSLGYHLPVTFKSTEKSKLYIRLNRKRLPLRATAFLLSNEKSQAIITNNNALIWTWKGILGFALIISITMFSLIKQRIFLQYFLLNLGFAIWMFSHIGDLNYFTGSDNSDWSTWLDYLGALLINLFLPLFVNNITPLYKRNILIWKIIRWVWWIMLFVVVLNIVPAIRLSSFAFWSHKSIMIGSAITFLAQPIMLFNCVRHRDRSSTQLFIVYSLLVLAGFMNIILPNLKLVEDSPYMYRSLLIGSIFEVFVFTYFVAKATLSVYRERAELTNAQQEHQKKVIESMVEAQENERNRIGRELHDSIGANMALIKQRIQNQKQGVEELVGDTIEKVRGLSRGLVASRMKPLEFIQEVREMCYQFSEGQMKVTFIEHSWPDVLADQTTNHLYRICQELLNNAQKHSQASSIYLQLIGDESGFIVLYEDNGVGFDIEQVKGGIGLESIQQRVSLINASIEIDSIPNKGVSITIKGKFE